MIMPLLSYELINIWYYQTHFGTVCMCNEWKKKHVNNFWLGIILSLESGNFPLYFLLFLEIQCASREFLVRYTSQGVSEILCFFTICTSPPLTLSCRLQGMCVDVTTTAHGWPWVRHRISNLREKHNNSGPPCNLTEQARNMGQVLFLRFTC